MNLTAFQHSPFLQSLGWAIANSLWQAAALWITYRLVIGIYKNASARFKNNLSTILLCCSFVWFCVTLFTKYFTIQRYSDSYNVQLYQADLKAASFNWHELLNNMAWILPYLSVAYLLLLVFFSVRLINIYRFTSFIKVSGLQKPGVEWKLFTEKVARHMGITKNIRLWVSHHIDVPATIGFLKPVILIPLASINQLSTDQMEAIILHELSHIKRNDYLINLFISIIETILFFNPFVVLLAKAIKKEREDCCDDFVIQYQYDRHAYASALLSLEQFRSVNLKLAIGATSGKKQLLLRIKRIMEINNSTNFNYGQKLAALLLITGVICSVAWLSPQHNKNIKVSASKSNEKGESKKIRKAEKFQALFVSPTVLKEENIVAKLQAKKSLNKAERQLKELKDLSVKEITALEYKRLHLLLQESKKAISRKKVDKFNVNKFFFANGATFARSFSDNARLLPYKAMLDNVTISGQQLNSKDLQKLLIDLDKAQVSFSFECVEMQNQIKEALNSNHIKEAFNSKQLKPSIITIKQGHTDAEVEKLINTEVHNLNERNLRRVYVNLVPTTVAGSNGRSVYIIDSAIVKESKLYRQLATVNGNKINTVKNKTAAEAELAYAYAYEDDVLILDGKVQQRLPVKSNPKPSVPNGSQSQAIIEASGFYHVHPNGNNTPSKTIVPKSNTQPQGNGNIRIDLKNKNGVIVINGKKIDLPEHDLVAVTLKGKRVLSRAKNLRELHIDN